MYSKGQGEKSFPSATRECHHKFQEGKPNGLKGIKRPQYSNENHWNWQGGGIKFICQQTRCGNA